MRRIRSGCCARAASGHAAAAPPSSVMNSRRLISITSSASASSVGGTSRPSALAVLRLMTSSILGRCLHRKVGWLLAFEDAIDVARRASVHVDPIRPIGQKATSGDEGALEVDRGKLVTRRKGNNQIAMNEGWPARGQNQTAIRGLRKGRDRAFDFVGVALVKRR